MTMEFNDFDMALSVQAQGVAKRLELTLTNQEGGPADDNKVTQVLRALGYVSQFDFDAVLKLNESMSVLPKFNVIREGESRSITCHFPLNWRCDEVTVYVVTEDGQTINDIHIDLLNLKMLPQGKENQAVITIPHDIGYGYHQLILSYEPLSVAFTSDVVICPAKCYQAFDPENSPKAWGVNTQLYGLRSQNNWGIGDFADLSLLLQQVAKGGGDFVGINPIHALFSAQPESASPYSPSSRQWLNWLYVSVCDVLDVQESDIAMEFCRSREFKDRVKALKQTDWVDYQRVAELKQTVLSFAFTAFQIQHLGKNTTRAQMFLDFVLEGGESLQRYAEFNALHDWYVKTQNTTCWGWPVFHSSHQTSQTAEVRQLIQDEKERVDFHLYLQWLAHTQLKSVQDTAEQLGMRIGLYQDLAVGVGDSGSETWGNENDTFVMSMSIGAPPDALAPQGQNWGLPPWNPLTLKNDHYQRWIDLLRANMRHCGALRVDHILGLLRQWWIPKGKASEAGVYIHFPFDILLDLLALESHRHRCIVIGEDLGTVPEGFTQTLHHRGIFSYQVFFFEQAADGGFYSPYHYPRQALTTLATHDMPTVCGYWQCRDIEMGCNFGWYDTSDKLMSQRKYNQQQILDSLAWHGYVHPPIKASESRISNALNRDLHFHIAAGNSALVSVQLEDWLAMTEPVNVPSTTDEYPNWRRKLSQPLESIFTEPHIQQLMHRLTELRSSNVTSS